MVTVQVQLAEELLALGGMDESLPSQAAAKLIALELFRESRVSLGKAAELAGVTLEDFMDFAAQRDVPLHYGTGELADDRATLRELGL